MVLENKLGITTSSELKNEEERLTKQRALELFEQNLLETDPINISSFSNLQRVHQYLFQDVYDFAGKMRTVNISKGSFRFTPSFYLNEALAGIDKMPDSDFDEIIAKYVEMNVAHPFREGNGRSMRIWLDTILKSRLGQVIDWSKIDKEAYLSAMERSPINSLELKTLLKEALTSNINDRETYMKGIDQSYAYEGYDEYKLAS